jgi:dTDP-4-amino-4,6-dideoxygalactose transaminase
VAAWYNEQLSGEDEVRIPWIAPTTTLMSWFVYVIQLSRHVDRRALMASLQERGIPTRPYFTPIHLQPFYVQWFGYRPGDFPVAEMLGETCLALPFSAKMTEAQVAFVCDELRAAVHAQMAHSRVAVAG